MLDLNILDVIFGQFTFHDRDDGSCIVVMTARNMKFQPGSRTDEHVPYEKPSFWRVDLVLPRARINHICQCHFPCVVQPDFFGQKSAKVVIPIVAVDVFADIARQHQIKLGRHLF